MGSVEREIESHDRFFNFIFLDRKRNFIRREEKIIEEDKASSQRKQKSITKSYVEKPWNKVVMIRIVHSHYI